MECRNKFSHALPTHLIWKFRDEIESTELKLEEFSPVWKNGLGVTTPEHFYLVDFIPGLHSPTKIDARSVVRLYREGLSAQQVAERLDISKQAVFARLRRFDVRNCRRGCAPDNFRYLPPYGQKVWRRRLVLNKKEIRVVRVMLRLRDQEQFRWSEIVAALAALGMKTRTGKTWSRSGVKRVHCRWSGKV